MAYLVEFPVGDGGTVVIEVGDDQLAGFAPAAAPGEIAARSKESFETAVDALLPAVRAIGERISRLGPEEVTVSMGVKITAEAGVIVAKTAGEANFTVTLRWAPGRPA
jgi:hypothetical protein